LQIYIKLMRKIKNIMIFKTILYYSNF